MTILNQILVAKRKEIALLRETPIRNDLQRNTISLIQKLEQASEMAVIAEFKRSSPSKGTISGNMDPIQQARLYEESGAFAISVLTDTPFFNGCYADLQAVRGAVNTPILCKDFILDEVQIDRAKSVGADLILLIVAALETHRLKELYEYAVHHHLEVLVEVHDEAELDVAKAIGAKLIGVNNRNLKTFEVNLNVTEQLAGKVAEMGALLISESGIHTKEDVLRVQKAGARGILVGEALMKSADVTKSIRDFKQPFRKEYML